VNTCASVGSFEDQEMLAPGKKVSGYKLNGGLRRFVINSVEKLKVYYEIRKNRV
jgi:hypothetical protein